MMYKYELGQEVIFKDCIAPKYKYGVIYSGDIDERGRNIYTIKSEKYYYGNISENDIQEYTKMLEPQKISGVRCGKDVAHINEMFFKEEREGWIGENTYKEILNRTGKSMCDGMVITSNPSGRTPFYKKYFENQEALKYLKYYNRYNNNVPSKVFYNDKKKATTLMYGNNAVVVKCGKGDKYNRRVGFLEAYFQATCGMSKNKALKYLNEIVKDKEVK